MGDATKRCSMCRVVKPLEAFYRHVLTSDGRQPRCRACCGNTHKAWVKTAVGREYRNALQRRKRLERKLVREEGAEPQAEVAVEPDEQQQIRDAIARRKAAGGDVRW